MPLFESLETDERPDIEKNRLFETLDKEKRGARDYLKVIAPVVLAVIVIGGAVIYFTIPGVGDEVRPPQILDDAVKTHFRDKEKRDVAEITYFYCKEFYAARAVLGKRPEVTAREYDHGSRIALGEESENGTWQISSRTVEPDATVDPCAR